VRVEVRPDEARVPAYTIPAGHPAIRAATAALEEVYPGEPVLLASIAGTLPATTLFERVLGVKTLFFSFSTSDENLHAPNEYLRIRRLREGMRAWELLWRLLADGPHRLEPAR
jgi:acetylornithine deacetylase/succinyl-diaminopimelate desuccinylase-like protein